VKKIKIKSYCKINLLLKVIKRLKNGYHNISSIITSCNLYDIITISKINSEKDQISFSGKFAKKINPNFNTITKVLYYLRNKNFLKKESFRINIKKNIPHGSGLGGGSSNAAALLKYFKNKRKLKISNNEIKKIAFKIGSDVPIILNKKNKILTGKKNEILNINNKFNLNIIIVYPNIICSTRRVFKKNKELSLNKFEFKRMVKNKVKLIHYLKNEKNDLEKAVVKIYPKVEKLINFIKIQPGCIFSRITGSGSACIGIFSDKINAISAQKLVKLKFPKYWSIVAKTM